jgi:hypothetical protein
MEKGGGFGGLEEATPQLSLPFHLWAQPNHPPATVAAVMWVWASIPHHRMTADGFLQSVGRLGALVGPLLRITQQSLPLLPPLSYGAVPIAAGLVLLIFLPETQGLPLPDTIQDLKNQ